MVVLAPILCPVRPTALSHLTPSELVHICTQMYCDLNQFIIITNNHTGTLVVKSS